jgi:glutaconate CoA-transferase subunit A
VQEADAAGNGRIRGPVYEDALLARASRRVILTAERIVGDAFFAGEAEKPQIPGFLVSHVVHCPRGAAPGCCPGEYGIDAEAIRRERGESP